MKRVVPDLNPELVHNMDEKYRNVLRCTVVFHHDTFGSFHMIKNGSGITFTDMSGRDLDSTECEAMIPCSKVRIASLKVLHGTKEGAYILNCNADFDIVRVSITDHPRCSYSVRITNDSVPDPVTYQYLSTDLDDYRTFYVHPSDMSEEELFQESTVSDIEWYHEMYAVLRDFMQNINEMKR